MVKKFFAYYKYGSEIKPINVYRALSVKNSRINNRDETIEFWDTPDLRNAEKVYPKRSSIDGKAAHFSYYGGSTRKGISSEMTMTHKIYEIVYSEMNKILLDAFGEQVLVFIKHASLEYFFRTAYNSYLIDVMLEIERTEPSSYYYKWNGKLALEIYVAHKVEKSKINDFSENRIQLFQIKIYDNQRVPEDIESEEQFNYYKQLIKKRIEKSNYKVIGSYLNNVFPEVGSTMEERYRILADFEREKQRLQELILNNEKMIKEQEEKIRNNEASLYGRRKELEKTHNQLIENGNKLKLVEKIHQQNIELNKQHQTDRETIFQLQNELNKEKEKGLFKKLFGK